MNKINSNNIGVAIISIYTTFSKYKQYPFFEREFGASVKPSSFRNYLEECGEYNYHFNPAYFEDNKIKNSFGRLLDNFEEYVESIGITFDNTAMKTPTDNLKRGQIDNNSTTKETIRTNTITKEENENKTTANTQEHSGADTKATTPNITNTTENSGTDTHTISGDSKKIFEDTPVNSSGSGMTDITAPSRKENNIDSASNIETLATKTEQTTKGTSTEETKYNSGITNNTTSTGETKNNSTESGKDNETTNNNKIAFDNFVKYLENYENKASYQKMIKKIFGKMVYENVAMF